MIAPGWACPRTRRLGSPRGAAGRGSGERGLTLLECAASLMLAAIVLAATTKVGEAAATLVRRAKMQADTLDLARNLLEHELGSPCGAAYPCPAGYRCGVTRSPVTAAADRIVATAERVDGEAREELATLAPPPACGA